PGKIPAAQRFSDVVQMKDIMPTILDVMGVKTKIRFDGRSLVPLMEGKERVPEPEMYITECTWMRKHGWRTPEWKLMHALEPDMHFKPEIELYNLIQDPEEYNNVAEQEPGVVKMLEARMKAWIKKREAETCRRNPIRTNKNWHGRGVRFKTSQEAYDALHIGSPKAAEALQAKELLRTLQDFALGRISIEEQTDDRLVLTVTECATCSGAPNIGEPLCYFEAGFIAGAMDGELAEHVRADETKCWGLGDRVCRWEVRRDGRKDGGNGADTLEIIMSLASRAAFAMENGIAVRQKNRELRRAYEQLRESERMKKDLTDMIVHDMRVPVNAVMGSIETLSDIMDVKLTPKESKLLEMALASGREAANMIDDLLDISRLEQQKMTLRKAAASVTELIERAVNQVGILARRKEISLETEIASGLPMLDVDRRRIVRVLVNLLSNAVQHTAPGGRIMLSAGSGDRNCVLIQVSDTGEGIPPEHHARIFDKFVQVESHKSRKRASTGLGLTFCKLVTEAHGGSIWVESSP
ncbi:MAG: ATP-binding protein, partial [Armatimonadetes bacterium]|nr:ATP-binding protein [Armatimonadota bacterium]